MLSTGLCFEVDEDQTTIGSKTQAFTQLHVNGSATTFRTANIIAVADSLEGLRPTSVMPGPDPNPPSRPAPAPAPAPAPDAPAA